MAEERGRWCGEEIGEGRARGELRGSSGGPPYQKAHNNQIREGRQGDDNDGGERGENRSAAVRGTEWKRTTGVIQEAYLCIF